jgi:tetratricopeptide (TPR) repeat protein
MKSAALPLILGCVSLTFAQTTDFRIALPEHKGQLSWSIPGFSLVESSAKPNGAEIGIRGRDATGKVSFLGFLFLAPEQAPMTSVRCRDAAIALDQKSGPVQILDSSVVPRPGALPVALVSYSVAARDGSLRYRARGFIAANDICGDLEFYGNSAISDDDANLRKAFQSFRLDTAYAPQFADIFEYAQVLFQHKEYRSAAPLFEKALGVIPSDGAPFPSAKIALRTTRDQAGMAYGISGDITKSRGIFAKGIAEDPDYPLYYYNLACADAEEKKLSDARTHLKQAFDRKAHLNPGEKLPVPTEDGSFLPFKSDRDFWAFLQSLR